MRWTAFIAGGIVGMAAATVLAKKRPAAFSWVSHAVGDAMKGMRERKMNRMVEIGLGSFANRENRASEAAGSAAGRAAHTATKKSTHKAGAAAAHKDSESWDRIEQLIESDPEAKRETEKIMAEGLGTAH
ncbi:hypothetical protein [Paenibacillus pinihumi]|uniref:hypothetical protein n=1 Tax=Paenibacillus pinihumi TaxID=669462 RepID=UPI000415B7C7|nr:hypothetical protein [Paenibacillus pinihumi]